MEFHYKNISDKLLEMKVPFARADGDALGSIALAVEAKTMPALVLYKNNRPTLFKVGDSNGFLDTLCYPKRSSYAYLKRFSFFLGSTPCRLGDIVCPKATGQACKTS